jgi:hypothetical protein
MARQLQSRYERLRSLAGKRNRVFFKLGDTATNLSSEGHVLNRWGQYWSVELVDQYLQLTSESFEDQEWEGAAYSYAAFLLQVNRLDEAENILHGLLATDIKVHAYHGLATAAARRGSLEEARAWVEEIPLDDPFRMSESLLLEERRIGQRFSRESER